MRPYLPVSAAALLACASSPPPAPTSGAPPAAPPASAPSAGSFEDAVAMMRGHAPVDVLETPGGGRIAVSARWQGRVMTSAVEPGGASLGFVHRAFIESGKTGTQFDNYGGEDRFWLGPEAGPFGLYFAPGAPFVIGSWQTPHAMQEGDWQVLDHDARSITFARSMHVVNYARAEFDVGVKRAVRVLDADEVRARFGDAPPAGAKWVAFETVNTITNSGSRAWTRDSGLLSVWILGMYAPSADARIVVPFASEGDGPIVNDAYFGKVPAERLAVHTQEGWLELVADGRYRSKIGVSPKRARDALGSWSARERLLTLVKYDKPPVGAGAPANGYVNSMWQTQADPYGGDVVNAYNDGPTEPGKPSLGGFYELETSSPAAALSPGQSITHVHTTLHVVGDPASLDPLAKRVLGVSLASVGK
jgi:hypothetical protein